MTIVKILLLASIGGIIGWVTNFLAIKLMFRPYNEFIIPIINLKVQGLIPKRKSELAKSIATTIEKELFSTNDLLETILTEDNQSQIMGLLKVKIKGAVKDKLPPMLALFSSSIMTMIDGMIEKEGKNILKEVLVHGTSMLSEKVKVAELVEEKINSFDLRKLEDIILEIASKELKHIEYLGGILGFLIGLIQGGIILLIG